MKNQVLEQLMTGKSVESECEGFFLNETKLPTIKVFLIAGGDLTATVVKMYS